MSTINEVIIVVIITSLVISIWKSIRLRGHIANGFNLLLVGILLLAAITFLAKDITEFSSVNSFDIWHDRAVFHFLTHESDIKKYVQNASESIKPGGYMIIGTFSNEGPKMCSDLPVQQYSEKELVSRFQENFDLVRGFTENHTTPSGSIQNFLFCIFKRK